MLESCKFSLKETFKWKLVRLDDVNKCINRLILLNDFNTFNKLDVHRMLFFGLFKKCYCSHIYKKEDINSPFSLYI